MPTFSEYKAGRADVCHVEKVNDQGAGVIHYVRLPDGYLLECGHGSGSEARAKAVCDAVNVMMKWNRDNSLSVVKPAPVAVMTGNT